jgi:hypothetical protein
MQRTNKLILAFAALAALEAIGFAIVINLLNHF